jgi:hypothetical protein
VVLLLVTEPPHIRLTGEIVAINPKDLTLDRKVTYLDPESREAVEILRSFIPPARRRHLMWLLTHHSASLQMADRDLRHLMTRLHIELRPDWEPFLGKNGVLSAYLASVRGAAQFSLEYHDLPPHWLRSFLARGFFIQHMFCARNARRLAHRTTVMEMNYRTQEFLERGRKKMEKWHSSFPNGRRAHWL